MTRHFFTTEFTILPPFLILKDQILASLSLKPAMATRKSSNSSSLLLLLLLPLLTIISLLASRAQSRQAPIFCHASSCGEIAEIRYPFRLTTDPPGCGELDFELSCENNKTIFNFHAGKYYVKQISYLDQLIRVVDVNLANGSCSLPFKSVSADEMYKDNYFSLNSGTYSSFFRCSSNISGTSYRIVPCLSGNGSYVFVTYSNYVISDLQGTCTFISRVPTIYQSVLFPSYESIQQLMQAGFDLRWSFGCADNPYKYQCYGGAFYVPTILEMVLNRVLGLWITINFIARFFVAPFILVGLLIHKCITNRKMTNDTEMAMLNHQPSVPRRYSYSGVVTITNQFNFKLGEGGFGTVYKGQLPNGCFVAVKMLSNSKGSDEDFIHEVSTIGKVHHVNAVKLLGFCSDRSNRALIFEYMPNGSLDKYIFSKEAEIQSFGWEKLLQIALGTARGVEHLHVGCDVCILHLDIKPQNVLLGGSFIPKVSDFGLTKFFREESDYASVGIATGTVGYIAPELISRNLGDVSSKSDVYSFGILLLEMVGRTRNANKEGNSSSESYFPSWIYDHLSNGGDLELKNATKAEAATARKLCLVGLWCIQKSPSHRPSMTKVVEMLEGNVDDLQLPSDALSFPQRTSEDPQSDSPTELLIAEVVERSA